MSTGDPAGLVQADDVDAIVVTDQPGERTITARSPMQLFWRRLRRDKVAMTALVFIVLLDPHGDLRAADRLDRSARPIRSNRTSRRSTSSAPRPARRPSTRSASTSLGRDIFSRTIYGARVSLEVALISTGIAVVIGTIVGLVAGFYRGWTDTVLSRITDVVLAFPILLLGLGLAAACSGANGCAAASSSPGSPS